MPYLSFSIKKKRFIFISYLLFLLEATTSFLE